MTAGAGLIWDLTAVDHASPAFLRVAGSADKAAAATAKASRGLEANVARMGKAGGALTKSLTLPLAALGAVSLDQAAKFQKSMTLIQTAGGETAAKAAAISVGIKKVATSTGTSLGQLGDGIYTVAKAGAAKWSATGQLEVLRAAAQGAKAEAVPLGTAVDALTTIMFDYGAKTSQAVKYEDELIRGSGLAKTSMQEYASSLSNVVPIAATVGLSFDQVAGAIATMTQHGNSPQQATENLRNLLFNLSGQNNVAAAAMQQLGINTLDLTKNLSRRGLTGTLELVDAALKAHTKNGLIVVNVHKSAALATKSLATELGSFSGKLHAQSEGLLKGSVNIKDYTKFAKSMGGQAGASALQFLALYKNSLGFSDQLRSGKGTYTTTTAALQKMLGGITGAGVAMQLGGQYAGQFSANTKAVGKAALDAGSDVLGWNKTQDTLAVKMDKAKASLQVLAVEIGTALIPAVSKIVSGVSGAVHWFDNLSGSGKKVLLWSAGIMLALGPILTIGSRLGIVGRGISGFAANAGTKIASLAGASEATATKVGNITRGMVRGVTGILAGAAAAQVGGNSGGGWLTSIMLGTAGGWALGGPVGAALSGVSAAIFKGVGLWNDHKNAAKQAAAEEVAFITNLTDAISVDNGALGANVRLTVEKKLQSKGVLDQAQKLGVSLASVVDAAMGKTGALDTSIVGPESALEARMAGLQKKLQKPGLTQEQSAPIQAQITSIYKQITAYENLRAALGLAAGDTATAQKKFDQAAHAMNDNRVAVGSYATQLAALRKHTTVALDANGQLNASLSASTVVGKHNRETIVSLIEAAKGQAQTTADNAAKHHTLTDSLIIGNTALSKNEAAIRKAALAAGMNKTYVDKLIFSMGVLSKVNPHPHIGVDTSQAGQKATALQRQIDRIRQNKVPGIKANTTAAANAIFNLQAQLDALRSKTITITAVTQGQLQGTYNQQVPFAARHPAKGGYITGPGSGTSDSIPAMISNGEYVINAKQTAKHLPLLTAINSGMRGFAGGGLVVNGIKYATQRAADNARTRIDSTSMQDIVTGIAGVLAAAHNALSTGGDLKDAAKQLKDAAAAGKVSSYALARLTSGGSLLAKLGNARDRISARLGTPNTSPTTAYDRLASAQQSYSDERTGVRGAISGSFDVTTAGQGQFNEPVSFLGIRMQLRKAVVNAKKFAATLKRLRREGLNGALWNQLALAGPAALPEALAIASATPKQLAAFNSDFKQLNTAGTGAGKYAADQMYGAGVKSAQGLVNGLKSQQSALNKAIRSLADGMVGQLRRTLGMHSPSRRLFDEARLAFQGYENGIQSKHRDIARAAAGAGDASVPGGSGGRLGRGGNTYNIHNEMHAHYPLEGDLQEAVKTLTRMSARQMREAGEALGR